MARRTRKDDTLILVPGDEGNLETGDGYRPELSAQHDADRSELYVIVGEEVGGMIEGVPAESFELLRERLS